MSGVPGVSLCLLSIPTLSSLPFNVSLQICFHCSFLSKSFFSVRSDALPLTSTFPFPLWPADCRLPALSHTPVFWAVAEWGSGPHPGWTGGSGCGGPGTGAATQVTAPHIPPLPTVRPFHKLPPPCPLPRGQSQVLSPCAHPQDSTSAECGGGHEIHALGGGKGCVPVLGRRAIHPGSWECHSLYHYPQKLTGQAR